MSGPQAVFVALCVLFIYVTTSQGFVSLLGRPVPLRWLDDSMTRPWHRAGVLRVVNLIWTATVAVGTQALVVYGIANGRDWTVRVAIVVALVIAAAWSLVLWATARRRNDPPSTG
jgi:hypothetical protein